MARAKVLAGGLASPVEIEQAFWSKVPEFLSRWLRQVAAMALSAVAPEPASH